MTKKRDYVMNEITLTFSHIIKAIESGKHVTVIEPVQKSGEGKSQGEIHVKRIYYKHLPTGWIYCLSLIVSLLNGELFRFDSLPPGLSYENEKDPELISAIQSHLTEAGTVWEISK